MLYITEFLRYVGAMDGSDITHLLQYRIVDEILRYYKCVAKRSFPSRVIVYFSLPDNRPETDIAETYQGSYELGHST